MSKEITDEMVKNFIFRKGSIGCDIDQLYKEWEAHKIEFSPKAGSPSGRDFEIIQYKEIIHTPPRDYEQLYTKLSNGLFYEGGNTLNTFEEERLTNPQYPSMSGNISIHSVRRINDSQIFTVGDEVKIRFHKPCKIISFEIVGGGTTMYVGGNFVYPEMFQNEDLMIVDKASPTSREPLFLTEDGKEIFDENTLIWVVNSVWALMNRSAAQKFLWDDRPELKGCFKYFSTEEVAASYVNLNKPLFSVQDVMNRLNGYFRKEATIAAFENLKAFAQQKINNPS